jgi:hypothetical protein
VKETACYSGDTEDNIKTDLAIEGVSCTGLEYNSFQAMLL